MISRGPYRSAPLQTRHRLVFEIGDEGVARLCESSVELSIRGEAAAWAEDYLLRAGMSVTRADEQAHATEALDEDHAEAALRGSLEAVEIIKRTLGIGAPGCVDDAARAASPRE